MKFVLIRLIVQVTMGADGGTIPKRCELVKNKKKKEKADKNAKKASRWRMCHLSQQPLRKPIIACRLGGLYNKEAVLNAILLKTIRNNVNTKHIRGLKDIKEVKLTANKEFKETGADKGDTYKDHNVAPYCCPVTGLVMNGNHSFTVNWRCGCIVSEKAIEEVKSTVCHGCGADFNKEDLVVLNPSEELRRKYEDKLELERELEREMKKAKKNSLKGIGDETAVHKTEGAHHHSITAAKRKAEKRKLEPTSIQDDEKASSAYKSLFTTCEAALNQPKAHWVTHNPLFY